MDMLALILSIIGSDQLGAGRHFQIRSGRLDLGGQTAVVSRIIYTIVGLGVDRGASRCCLPPPAQRRRDDA